MTNILKRSLLKLTPNNNKRGKSSFSPRLRRLISQLNLNVLWEKSQNQSFQGWVIIVLTSIIIGVLLSPNIPLPKKRYEVGDISQKDIKAKGDLLIEDKLSTEKRRQKAMEELKPIYDFDQTAIQGVKEKLSRAFGMMQENYQEVEEKTGKTLASRSKEDFEEALGFPVSDKDFRILKINKFNPNIEKYISSLVAPILKKEIVSNKDLLMNEGKKGIIIRKIQTKEEIFHGDVSSILDLEEAKKLIIQRSRENLPRISKPFRNVIIRTSQQFITPNLTFNKNATEERRQKILREVKPVFFQIKRGEMIIREGEKVKEEHLLKLAAMRGDEKEYKILLASLGLIFLASLILYIAYRLSTNIKRFSKNISNLLLFSVILVIVILLIKASIFMASAISDGFPLIPFNSLLYAIPLTIGAMLIAVLLNAEIALIFSLTVSIFASLLLEDRMAFFIYFIIGNVIAVRGVARCSQRTDLIKAGFFVGLINILTIICLKIAEGSFHLNDLLDGAFGFTGGVLAGIMVTGIIPLFETLFGYTTDIKLLELANLNQPVLRDLVVQAPGTYHHSMIVGSLVEAAAESINANPLLAKVSAYYHDVGKIKKPLYFVENQKDKENRHDKLAPSMSSLILISHVKDGVELARANRLGKAIIDIIQQHHGTNLISYFYQKAKEQENPGVQSVDEKDYRYPGPKPQTKEAGLVLLADAIEAVSKTLTDPTPSRVKGLVQKVINSSFTDGQLNECELTLKDLYQIGNSFTRILNGIFHRRIDYPEPAPEKNEEEKGPDGSIDKQSTKPAKGSSKRSKKNGSEDLKQPKM